MRRLLWWANLALVAATALAYLSPYVAPTTLWPISFLALGYPVLLLANVLAAAYWFWRREWRGLASVAVIALGVALGHTGELYGTGSPQLPQNDTAQDITFVTYNTFGGRGLADSTPPRMKARVIRMLDCLDADVIAFEETAKYPALRKLLYAALDSMGLRHHYSPAETFVSLHSRYPLSEKRLLGAYNNSNGAISVKLSPPSGPPVRVIAAHLQSNQIKLDAGQVVRDVANARKRAYWTIKGVAANYRAAARQRAEQATELAQIVAAEDLPVVLLGDLNDVPLSYALGELRRAGLADSFSEAGEGSGVSYPGSIPGLRIDYILHSEQIEAVESEVLECPFSDHWPARAVLRVQVLKG